MLCTTFLLQCQLVLIPYQISGCVQYWTQHWHCWIRMLLGMWRLLTKNQTQQRSWQLCPALTADWCQCVDRSNLSPCGSVPSQHRTQLLSQSRKRMDNHMAINHGKKLLLLIAPASKMQDTHTQHLHLLWKILFSSTYCHRGKYSGFSYLANCSQPCYTHWLIACCTFFTAPNRTAEHTNLQ